MNLLKELFSRRKTAMKIQTVRIEGMMCDHCRQHAEKALAALPGVISANVDLAKKTGTVTSENGIADELIRQAVADAGYSVV